MAHCALSADTDEVSATMRTNGRWSGVRMVSWGELGDGYTSSSAAD